MKLEIGKKYKFYLSDTLDVEDRLIEINKLLQQEVEFDDLKCTIEEYLKLTWNKDSTRTGLDIIGYYLSKKPNQNKTIDKEILSKRQIDEMKNGLYKGEQRYLNFTYLPDEMKDLFGIEKEEKE